MTLTNEVSVYVTLLGSITLHGYVCSCGVLAMTKQNVNKFLMSVDVRGTIKFHALKELRVTITC